MLTTLLFKTVASASAVVNCGGSNNCATGLPIVNGGSNVLQMTLQIVFGIIAAVAVLIIVISGLRFVISDGNPENVSKARETILYAIIGLVIALLAEVIVSFVLDKI